MSVNSSEIRERQFANMFERLMQNGCKGWKMLEDDDPRPYSAPLVHWVQKPGDRAFGQFYKFEEFDFTPNKNYKQTLCAEGTGGRVDGTATIDGKTWMDIEFKLRTESLMTYDSGFINEPTKWRFAKKRWDKEKVDTLYVMSWHDPYYDFRQPDKHTRVFTTVWKLSDYFENRLKMPKLERVPVPETQMEMTADKDLVMQPKYFLPIKEARMITISEENYHELGQVK